MIEVRAAADVDEAGIARLLWQLGYPSGPDEVLGRIRTFKSSPTDAALVAVGGDGVVGLCSITVIPLFAEGGALARLTSLVVATDTRRRGIGRRLVEAAEAWAVQRGCECSQVSSGRRPERRAAHALYPALGYQDTHSHHVLYAKRLISNSERQS